ncbi:MAG: hypothetical protein JOZ55_07305 [Alphaproteobacteria bacterium]|nr:hypothetical protein [Alphaproteobacteria bacterium]
MRFDPRGRLPVLLPARVVLAALFISSAASAATISDSEAASHVGRPVTVQGIVSGTHIARSGTEFLDFGPHYPNENFTAVIFSSTASAFGDISAYYGKRVEVTGTVRLFHGRPEIVLETPRQLKVAP